MSSGILYGTVTIDTSGLRTLDIPAESVFTEATDSIPVPFLSTVVTTDPADSQLFKLTVNGISGIGDGNADPVRAWGGVRQLPIYYTLTGGSPISVDIYLVWDAEADLNDALVYAGS
jgi:hypothetical protein